MCGLIGRVLPVDRPASPLRADLTRALGLQAHRGPDGSGLWIHGNVALGHNRLAVRDPLAEAAAQPLKSPCGRYVLVYNGELYDDAQWRAELMPEVLALTGGAGFRTGCDAETLLWALMLRGTRALDRLRGMYALAFVDTRERTLLLARDPMGIKPLVLAQTTDGGLAFASETKALLEIPGVRTAPDHEMLSAYLATSRRSLFGRTLFQGVHCVLPGDVLRVDLAAQAPRARRVASGERFARRVQAGPMDPDECRAVLSASVAAHLVADVPLCSLLSGGLDSAIVASEARAAHGPIQTWCSYGTEGGQELGEDPAAARAMAEHLDTQHRGVPIDEATFLGQWRAHVEHLGLPLSTPNEVAIAEISRALRAGGSVVALSGEGADELFGGYGQVLAGLSAHASLEEPPIDAGRFHLELTAWLSPAAQDQFLTPRMHGASDFVIAGFGAQYERARRAAGPAAHPLEAHLRVQQAVNLAGLLERLDAATMRHGVEGRTPFVDLEVRRFADRLAFEHKFQVEQDGGHRSKIALRRAFEGRLPAPVLARPKASFPMPFERWAAPVARGAVHSPLVRELVLPEVLERLGAAPEQHWRLGWLLGNLALFGEVAFGAPAAASAA